MFDPSDNGERRLDPMDDPGKPPQIHAAALARIKAERRRLIRAEHEHRAARSAYELAIVQALDEIGADLGSRIDEITGAVSPPPAAAPQA
jgi:hypothetical protein